MALEIGWDSEKPGYEGLIDAAHRMMIGRSNSEATEAAVRILRHCFLHCCWNLQNAYFTHAGGEVAAVMVFVEKCKYLEESKCVGVCINTCKLPTQDLFKERMGVPLVMEPNFRDFSCQVQLVQLTSVMICVAVVTVTISVLKSVLVASFNSILSQPCNEPFYIVSELGYLVDAKFNFGVLPPEDDSIMKEPCRERYVQLRISAGKSTAHWMWSNVPRLKITYSLKNNDT